MRKTLTTAALVLALSCPAWAGIMHTPPAPEPPPPSQPASAVQEPTDEATLNGEIPTPGVSESLTQIALELLAILPSLP
jgi:hypothetical protein